MYGYQSDIALNPFLLLNEYSQEEIFEIGLGEFPSLTKHYLSPFREDSTPKCFFSWSGDKLFFVDFGDISRKGHRDCFNFLMDLFNICSYADLAQYIINHFANSANKERCKKTTREEWREKEKTEIIVTKRHFNSQDGLIWKPFEITPMQLVQDNVFGTDFFKVHSSKHRRWFTIKPHLNTFVIEGFEEGRCKIYTPYEKDKKKKWLTNCTANDVGGIETLDFLKDVLIITKSYKDWRVLKNQGYNVIWFQNEGMFPTKKSILQRILAFPVICIFFDNDEAGVKASQNLFSLLSSLKEDILIKQIFSPYPYLTDAAEIISCKGKQILNEFLWKNCQR